MQPEPQNPAGAPQPPHQQQAYPQQPYASQQPYAPQPPYAPQQHPRQGFPPYQQPGTGQPSSAGQPPGPGQQPYLPGAGQPHYQQAASSAAAMSAKARHGQRNMVFGGLWLGGGLLITIITLSSGSPVFIVAWGAILGGLIQFIAGAREYSKNKG
ncbi:hypothetical protein [Rugosimonospora africana]|nr:hypothetical protein [Rugosimonospora africana]